MKAIILNGKQQDLDEVTRISREVGSNLYHNRGNKIKVLGYGPVLLADGSLVKVVILEGDGRRSGPGRGDAMLEPK